MSKPEGHTLLRPEWVQEPDNSGDPHNVKDPNIMTKSTMRNAMLHWTFDDRV